MKCKNFDSCNAPICPRDAESITNCIWYPGENICSLVDVPEFIKRQRRVARLAPDTGYFTAEMLAHGFIMRKGIRGLDPDRPARYRGEDVIKWLADHHSISEEKRAEMRERAWKNLSSSSGDNACSKAPRRPLEGVSGEKGKITQQRNKAAGSPDEEASK